MKILNRQKIFCGLLFLALFLATMGDLHAQPSSASSISFQGALNGPDAQALPNGSYSLTFRFYTNSTTLNVLGVTNVAGVAVANGLASTLIPVDPVWFRNATHLGVTINGAPELLPRVPITAVPSAMYFKGPRIDMQGSNNLAIVFNEGNDPSGNWTLQSEAFANGNFGIIRRDPGPELVKSFIITPQGNVGIGTLPGVKLDVLGTIQTTRIDLRAPNLGISFYESLDPAGNWALQTEAFANGNFGIIRRDPTPSPTFIITPAGNIGIGTFSPATKLEVNGTTRTTVLQITSDRNAKQDFKQVDAVAVLKKLTALPISTWAYTNGPSVRHIGPVAQDFHAAFRFGDSDKHIATVDADGVAFAAIQGLHQMVQEKEARIAELEARLSALETSVARSLGTPTEKLKARSGEETAASLSGAKP